MRLFHFSDDPEITVFYPRPVRVPSVRPPGKEWLNGPLVWAIDDWHQPMYLFPRDCPRVLAWPIDTTTEEDRRTWFPRDKARMIAYIEQCRFQELRTRSVVRYELPAETFEDLHDAGMWVSQEPVRPLRAEILRDLPAELRERDVELRVVESLAPLRTLWDTTLHVSGIRLRNAAD